MSHEEVVETWLTELAVAPRHQARRERANEAALTASARESERPAEAPPPA
jgi:hypothetical protein